MTQRKFREAGQAAPIYIMMVVGLLFLALAFFAVGQAGATRNGAQSAADAAALAAAQDSRDKFEEDLVKNLLDPDYLDDIFNGGVIGSSEGCNAAAPFANQNGADVVGCGAAGSGRWGFTVHVITQASMGDSILPGTENRHAEAQATAIVEPRCDFQPAEDEGTPPPENGGDNTEPASPGELDCDEGLNWEIDPQQLGDLPEMADLFSVRLAQD